MSKIFKNTVLGLVTFSVEFLSTKKVTNFKNQNKMKYTTKLILAAIVFACLVGTTACNKNRVKIVWAERTNFTDSVKETMQKAAEAYNKNYLNVYDTLWVTDTTIVDTPGKEWPLALGCSRHIYLNNKYLEDHICNTEHLFHVCLHELFHSVSNSNAQDKQTLTILLDGSAVVSHGLCFTILTKSQISKFEEYGEFHGTRHSEFEEASAEACARALDPRRYNYAYSSYWVMATLTQKMINLHYFSPRFLLKCTETNDPVSFVARVLHIKKNQVTAQNMREVIDIYNQARYVAHKTHVDENTCDSYLSELQAMRKPDKKTTNAKNKKSDDDE